MLVSTFVSALSLFAVASAQSSTTASPVASASPSTVAVAAPGSNGYSYVGCYNETTEVADTAGVRALTGGKMETGNDTTVAACLQYCGDSNYQYAGLEYARECWCGNYLSSFSTELPASNCSLPCMGNSTELCGGFLTLNLYNLTSRRSGSSGSSSNSSAASSVAAASWTYVLGAGAVALTLGAAL